MSGDTLHPFVRWIIYDVKYSNLLNKVIIN